MLLSAYTIAVVILVSASLSAAPVNDQASSILTIPFQKYNSLRTIETAHNDILRTYDKFGWTFPAHSVLRKRAVPLGNDGRDSVYYGPITLGTPPTNLLVQFDTGSTRLVVAGVGLGIQEGGRTPLFNSSASSTAINTGVLYSSSFGDGSSINGTVYQDIVSIDSGSSILSFPSQNVSVYNASSGGAPGAVFLPVDLSGILGLQSVAGLQNSFFENLRLENKLLPSPEFSFALSTQETSLSSPTTGASGGYLTIGGVNSSFFSGQLEYISLCVGNDDERWAIPLSDIVVDGISTGVRAQCAILDTGTTLSYLPQSSIAAIFLNVPGSRLLSDGVTTAFPCDAKFSVGFTFGKQTFVISKNDLIYNKNIAGVGCTSTLVVGDSAQVLLGDIFFKSVYASFNGSTAAGEYGSIGLAPLVDPSNALESNPVPKSNSTAATPPAPSKPTKSAAELSRRVSLGFLVLAVVVLFP